ncbi:MAG: dicarboxylate/amino acid:cation symporter [Treponema sp.]|uniref:dicarboxylate/amino acid:cation symporter n=1 Tax=Treponema sp. TaxID=166 RepID=UPI001B560C9F|nr:cation:dicarboxylase symporter family transporter [Treponema sp.]MBP5588270.1 dicarboxylate/amino acid:cation symporter [Treponema sp.]MBR0155459.1 dicarboxylate/amino acid:cation symporter [Treponema sp.]MCR5386784.1 cation:dicarboxylase symporter family transporter [Treponema sp.]
MKIWMKYLIGIALGLASALILPLDSQLGSSILAFVTEIVIRIGRYTIIPLLFFSGIMAVYRLNDAKIVWKTSLWTAGVIVASSLLLTILGFISIVLIKLPRIPIITEKVSQVSTINIQEIIRKMIPFSSVDSLIDGEFFLPAFIFALIVGAGCCMEHSNIKPILSLSDALSELFFNISTIVTDLLSVGMIAIMCNWTVQFRAVIMRGVFNPLIIMLTVDFILVAGVIYPLIIRTLCRGGKPLKVLSACVVPFITAFFSGDTNLTLPINMRLGKEKLGIRQRTNGFVYPLFSIFARGGSTLVVIISFVVIWRSYSTLPIEFFDMLWISGTAFFLSFLLGGMSTGGTFIALTVLCTIYGRGMETGYLLLKPAAAIIGSFAALFDAATTMFGSYIVANNTKTIERHRA